MSITRYFGIVLATAVFCASLAIAQEDAPANSPPLPPPSKITGKSPAEVEAAAPKGTLRNPYTGQADKADEGHKLFLSYSCSGCHGGNGGGGMCPQLTHVIWIYGSDDDTLFRLVTLGSQALQAKGYSRQNVVNVIGPMPAFGTLIKSDDELWKLLAFVRSVYKGNPAKKNW
jgi:mono/diheme cytochrome c family protein